MRVLYFHQHFSTPKGATGIRSYEMAMELLRNGHQVTMVCGRYAGGETQLANSFVGGYRRGTVDGIDVIEFDLSYSNEHGFLKRSLTFLKFSLKSLTLVFSEKYDVIFATTTPLTAGIPGIFARWFRGKPFVFEVRDLWPELPKAMGVIQNPIALSLMSALEWVSYHSAQRLIGLSPGIVDGIVRRGIAPERVAMIPNGADNHLFGAAQSYWRPEPLSKDDFVAVFAGTHGIANGLDSVLNVAAELLRLNRGDIKLLLIGAGRVKRALQKRALEEGLTNVIFQEPLGKAQLAQLLASSNLGLQILRNVPAFYFGTSPNKFFDYVSAGLPVLNNYPGWLANMIEANQCGFVVPPDDPVAFAQALISACDNREVLHKMAERSKKIAQEFDRKKLAEQWISWVQGVAR